MDATLKLPILTKNQLKYLQRARNELSKAGVSFDSGYDLREGIFEWKLDWSLKGAKITDKKELVFDSKQTEKIKYIINAEDKLKQGQLYFNSKLDKENRIVWDLNEIRGAELVIRKTRKESTEGVKKVKPKLKIYRKGETE